jgi:hypothetical protein
MGRADALAPPPPDLAQRALPIELAPEGGRVWRIHQAKHGPIFFGTSRANRFDDPDGGFGVLYASTSPEGAFAETCLRETEKSFVTEAFLAERALAVLALKKPLRLVKAHGAGLRRLGVSADLTTGAIATPQRWSAALHAHLEAPDGLVCRARHDNDQMSLAIFDRAADRIEIVASESLLVDRGRLGAMLDRYGVGLI